MTSTFHFSSREGQRKPVREESGVDFVQEGNHRNRYYAIIGIQADGLPYNHAWQGCVSHLPRALPQAMFYDPFRVWCKNLFIYTLLIKGKVKK